LRIIKAKLPFKIILSENSKFFYIVKVEKPRGKGILDGEILFRYKTKVAAIKAFNLIIKNWEDKNDKN